MQPSQGVQVWSGLCVPTHVGNHKSRLVPPLLPAFHMSAPFNIADFRQRCASEWSVLQGELQDALQDLAPGQRSDHVLREPDAGLVRVPGLQDVFLALTGELQAATKAATANPKAPNKTSKNPTWKEVADQLQASQPRRKPAHELKPADWHLQFQQYGWVFSSLGIKLPVTANINQAQQHPVELPPSAVQQPVQLQPPAGQQPAARQPLAGQGQVEQQPPVAQQPVDVRPPAVQEASELQLFAGQLPSELQPPAAQHSGQQQPPAAERTDELQPPVLHALAQTQTKRGRKANQPRKLYPADVPGPDDEQLAPDTNNQQEASMVTGTKRKRSAKQSNADERPEQLPDAVSADSDVVAVATRGHKRKAAEQLIEVTGTQSAAAGSNATQRPADNSSQLLLTESQTALLSADVLQLHTAHGLSQPTQLPTQPPTQPTDTQAQLTAVQPEPTQLPTQLPEMQTQPTAAQPPQTQPTDSQPPQPQPTASQPAASQPPQVQPTAGQPPTLLDAQNPAPTGGQTLQPPVPMVVDIAIDAASLVDSVVTAWKRKLLHGAANLQSVRAALLTDGAARQVGGKGTAGSVMPTAPEGDVLAACDRLLHVLRHAIRTGVAPPLPQSQIMLQPSADAATATCPATAAAGIVGAATATQPGATATADSATATQPGATAAADTHATNHHNDASNTDFSNHGALPADEALVHMSISQPSQPTQVMLELLIPSTMALSRLLDILSPPASSGTYTDVAAKGSYLFVEGVMYRRLGSRGEDPSVALLEFCRSKLLAPTHLDARAGYQFVGKTIVTDRSQPFRVEDLEGVTVGDLTVRISTHPAYIIYHAGQEHVLRVIDVRKLLPSDESFLHAYPVVLWRSKEQSVQAAPKGCNLCGSNQPAYTVKDDPLGMARVMAYCKKCFEMMHLDAKGQRLHPGLQVLNVS